MIHKELLEQRIQKRYASISDDIKDDIELAARWAKEVLRDHEGSGHLLFVSASGANRVCCSFAKPEWPGDHCGRGMDHGAEAIVMAVCEYLEGA